MRFSKYFQECSVPVLDETKDVEELNTFNEENDPLQGLRDIANSNTAKGSFQKSAYSFNSCGIDNFSQADQGHHSMSHLRECFCKLLLTCVEFEEVFKSSSSCGLSELETTTGVSVASSAYSLSMDDKVVVLTGSMSQLHSSLAIIADRIGSTRDSEFISVLRRKIVNIRIVVPNSVVGVLMGREGKDIRNLAVTSGVRIQISQRILGVLERVVHVTGTVQQAIIAATTIVETIQTDPHTQEHAKIVPTSFFTSTSSSSSSSSSPIALPSQYSSSHSLIDPPAEEGAIAELLSQLLAQLSQHPELLEN